MKLQQILKWLCICIGANALVSATDAGELDRVLSIYSREVDLARETCVSTNAVFDAKICNLLSQRFKNLREVSFVGVSLTFGYPDKTNVMPSHVETGIIHSLTNNHGAAVRVYGNTNVVPISFVRVYNPSLKNASADVDFVVLVVESPPLKCHLEHPSVHYEMSGTWTNAVFRLLR